MLHNDNNNRTVVITGANKGFGKSIAEEFAKNGYSVLLNSLDEQELKIVANDISNIIGNNDRIAYLVGDISNENFSEALMEETV